MRISLRAFLNSRASAAACVARIHLLATSHGRGGIVLGGVVSVFQRLREDLSSHGGAYFLTIVLLVGVGFVPLPYVRSAPGSTYDALGSIDGKQLVNVAESNAYPTFASDGEIQILTVSQWGGPYGTLTWPDALRSLLDSSIYIIPSGFLFDENTDGDEVTDEGQVQFASAQSEAIGAAFGYLGIPVETATSIVFINKESPNRDVLKVGDEIVEADGVSISNADDFGKVVAAKKPGSKITVVLLRDSKRKTLSLETYSLPGETRSRIGVILMVNYEPPMKVTFSLNDVGGPSAGLAFATALVEKLGEEDLLRGRNVAMTGEIDAAGNVGAIGGMPQKMASAARNGATLMLFPRENCPISRERVPDELTIVPVSTLSEAIEALRLSDSTKYPTC